MDSNLTSCDRCGHTSSQEAEVCAYCGAVFSDSGGAVSNESDNSDNAATELNAAIAEEAPVGIETENAGPPVPTDPIAPAPEQVEDNHLGESQPDIEIPEAPEIAAVEQAAVVEGEAIQEEPIIDALQSVNDPDSESTDFPATPVATSAPDQEKLVIDLPAETGVADLLTKDDLDTALADIAPESESAAIEAADQDSMDPEKTLTTAEAPANVISLVKELAANSQPELSADESENELEISIEPVQEEPKLENKPDEAKSDPLDETIVLLPEAEIAPPEADSKKGEPEGKSAAAGQHVLESPEVGNAAVETITPVLQPDQPQESAALSESASKATVEPDTGRESTSDGQKTVSKAQLIALKRRKLAKIAALKKKKIALAKAKALEKKKAAIAKGQSSKKEEAPAAASAPQEGTGHGIAAILEKYKGQTIGINYDHLAGIAEADLIEVNNAYFCVVAKENKFQYSFPIKTILSIVEGEDGVEIGESNKELKFTAVVKVFPVVLF